MPAPRVLILRAPGTNCDQETAYAFTLAGATTEACHINRLLSEPGLLDQFQILCLPGGFSYGDDIAAGRILANQFRHHLLEPLSRFRDRGSLILGICNGFQILIKSGVLLADEPAGAPATLTWNSGGLYQDRWVNLRTASDRCVFLRGIDRMYLPIAHAEGKFVTRDHATLERLGAAGQLALCYAAPEGGTTAAPGAASGALSGGSQGGELPFPLNPNGAVANVAGVCDATGRVFGLMPHPERHIDPTHHPRWTRMPARAAGDGLKLFQNAVEYFA
jgi:phosphoribosylformylglycinamidine (FGAM) synthase-like amidotransferase family enzyme